MAHRRQPVEILAITPQPTLAARDDATRAGRRKGRRLSTRLGVPNFPGDTMTLTGEVTAVEGDTVTLVVTGRNSKGVHTRSEVTLQLTGGKGA